MNYRLLLHKSVTKFIEKCSNKQNIKQKLKLLKQNPYNYAQLDIKVIQGYKNLYRLNELIIFMFKAGNRGDVYKSI